MTTTAPAPAPVPDDVLRDRYAEAMRQAFGHAITAEWICCDPPQRGHKLCKKGHAALRMVTALLTDDPESHPERSPVLDALLAVRDTELERLRADRDRAREIAVALEQENARLREHIAFVLAAARERDKEMLHLRDTHKASKRTQTRGHAWEEAAYEVRKIAELLERVDSPT